MRCVDDLTNTTPKFRNAKSKSPIPMKKKNSKSISGTALSALSAITPTTVKEDVEFVNL